LIESPGILLTVLAFALVIGPLVFYMNSATIWSGVGAA
jgi:hypothetical protein